MTEITITSTQLREAAERIHAATESRDVRVSFDYGIQFAIPECKFWVWAGSDNGSGPTLGDAVDRLLAKTGTAQTRRANELAKLKKAMAEHGITAKELE